MAASSPYSGNDYNAVSTYRPYQLPVNDIFKALVAQNEYWEQGARRVKSVYDNALNLKLTNVQNRQIRDQFMQDAEKEITKLSAMDLSDPSVQRQGFGIFQPLFKDRGVVSDDAATRHIDKVNAEALSFRTKNNGKEYSQINHMYALDGADEFRNSTDRFAGEKFLEKAKNYEPYYDYTAEYDKIIKNCPSDSAEGDSVLSESGYIQTQTMKSRSAAKVRTCLEAGLSPKAYRQMQIEGYMNYKGRPQVLRDDYIDFLSSSGDNISTQIQALSGRLEGINNDKNLKADDKAAIVEQVNKQIDSLKDELSNTTTNITKLRSGDMSPIQGNEELISGSLYQYRKMLKESYAAAFQEVKNTFKADPVSLQRFKFQQDVQLRNIDARNDVLMAMLDHDYDVDLAQLNHANALELENIKQTAKGAGAGSSAAIKWDPQTRQFVPNSNLQPVSANFTDKPTDTGGYKNIQDQISGINEVIKNNDDYLFNSFISRGESDPEFRDRLVKAFNTPWDKIKANGNRFSSDGKVVTLGETVWFKNYVKGNANDPDIDKWNRINSEAKLGAQALNTQLEQSEAVVATKLGIKRLKKEGEDRLETAVEAVSRAVRGEIQEFGSTTVDGVTITPQDIQDALEGKANSKGLQVVRKETSTEGNRGQAKTFDSTFITVNGKNVPSVNKLFDRIRAKNSDFNDKLETARKDVYSKVEFQNEPWFFSIDDESTAAQVFQNAFPLDEEKDGKKRGVKIEQLNFEGGFKVRVPGLTDDEFARAQGLGYGKEFVTRDPSDPDLLTIKSSNYNVLPSAQMNPGAKRTAYILSTIMKGADFAKAKPGEVIKSAEVEFPMIDPDGNQRKLKVQPRKDVDGSATYTIISTMDSKGNPENRILSSNMKDPFAVMKYLQNINSFR